MTARDSDEDLRKFMPDMEAIRREADPAYGEKKFRAAMNNPALDAALAEVKQAPKVEPGPAPKEPARVLVATKPKKVVLPRWVVYTLAVLAVVVPAALVLYFSRMSPPPPGGLGAERLMGSNGNSVGGVPIAADAGADTGTATDTGTDTATGTGTAKGTPSSISRTTPARPLVHPEPTAKPARTAGPTATVEPVAPPPTSAPTAEPAPTTAPTAADIMH